MTIRINHLDKNRASTQSAAISLVMTDPILVSKASYTSHEAVSGLLFGSLYTLLDLLPTL